MTETIQQINSPSGSLQKFYRQPEIFISLPNGSLFYPEGVLDTTAAGELPVYALTAKNDIALKTPDSLMTGNAVVECIKSCVPNILDPWEMPATDIDYIIIAMRIASYGNEMSFESSCPFDECEGEEAFAIDLSAYIDELSSKPVSVQSTVIKHKVNKEEIKIHIKPLSYKEFSLLQRRSYEEQKVAIMAESQDDITEIERMEMFNSVLKNMTDLNCEVISSGISHIILPDDQRIDNTDELVDFVNNSPVGLFKKISSAIDAIREKSEIEPLSIECGTCKKTYTAPLILDYSTFFA